MVVTASSEPPAKAPVSLSGVSTGLCKEKEATVVYVQSILLLSHVLNVRITFF
jgi:hypothetical protein